LADHPHWTYVINLRLEQGLPCSDLAKECNVYE